MSYQSGIRVAVSVVVACEGCGRVARDVMGDMSRREAAWLFGARLRRGGWWRSGMVWRCDRCLAGPARLGWLARLRQWWAS